MIKAFTIVFIALITLAQNAQAQTGMHVPELANFDAAMLELLDDYNVPGGQLAITRNGKLVYNRGFGFADTAAQTLVQPDHIFRIASVSKPITSVAVMKLVENGLVELNDTVFGTNGILNDATYQDILDPRVYDITVAQLLRHESGWDRDVSGDPMLDAYNIATAMGTASPPDVVTTIQYVLANIMLDFTPGTDYSYSNFGYAILGRIIEKLTGQAYENYVRNEIMLPIGITNIHIGKNLLADQLPNEVTYYDFPGATQAVSVYDNTTLLSRPYGGFNLEAMDAHGGGVASAEELCELLVAVDGFPTKPDILSSASLDAMTEPSVFVNYALGWAVNSFNNWWHNGSLPGTTSEVVRAGNTQLNWAILLNTRGNTNALDVAVDELVWSVLPTISSWPTHDLFTSIETLTTENISIYPTVSSGALTVRSTNAIESIEVYDMLGRKLFESKPADVIAHIDLRTQPKGMYVVKCLGETTVHTQTIVLQ